MTTDQEDLTGAPSEEDTLWQLTCIAEKAMKHWDSLGKPYPEHLRSLIHYLLWHSVKGRKNNE